MPETTLKTYNFVATAVYRTSGQAADREAANRQALAIEAEIIGSMRHTGITPIVNVTVDLAPGADRPAMLDDMLRGYLGRDEDMIDRMDIPEYLHRFVVLSEGANDGRYMVTTETSLESAIAEASEIEKTADEPMRALAIWDLDTGDSYAIEREYSARKNA